MTTNLTNFRHTSKVIDWDNPANVIQLRDLWMEGHSTAEIGRRMGVTKNTVVGKAGRLKLPPRPSPIIRDGREPKDGRTYVLRTPRDTLPPLPSVAAEPHGVVVPLAIPRSAIAAPRPSRAITAPVSPIMAHLIGVRGVRPEPVPIERVQAAPKPKPYMRVGECTWTDSDCAPWLWCGEPTIKGGSWCAAHHKRVFHNYRLQTVENLAGIKDAAD